MDGPIRWAAGVVVSERPLGDANRPRPGRAVNREAIGPSGMWLSGWSGAVAVANRL
jgi:hypothetical protein